MRIKQFILASALLSSVILTGCSTSFSPTLSGGASPEIVSGQPFSGKAMGGQSPIGGSHLYMYAANTNRYGGASISLLKGDPTAQYPSHQDANGAYYINTASNGAFYFEAGQYQCALGQEVYLYLVGGDAGYGTNNAISELLVLGTCNAFGAPTPFSALATPTSFVYMNEESTIAAAYALAGFAVDSTHISSSTSNLSQVSLVRAFQNAAQLYNISQPAPSTANTVTPNGNGTVPYLELNSLADILASCINNTFAANSSNNCTTLLSNATDSSGTSPTTTSDAAINIAHNPAHNVSNLATLYNQASVFQPVLGAVPNDFSVVLSFNAGTNTHPAGIAIDANADIWIANNNTGTVTEWNSLGTPVEDSTGASQPPGGFTNANMFTPVGVALDTNGDAFVADSTYNYVIMIPTGGGTTTSFTGRDLSNAATSVAVDQNGNVWVAQNSNTAVQFAYDTTSGVYKENFAATGGGLRTQAFPACIAIDPANDAFIANTSLSSVAEFTSTGTPVTSSTSNNPNGYGYSLNQHLGQGIAFDDAGNFWVANQREASILEGSAGGSAALINKTNTAAAGINSPAGIAFDGASRAWIANTSGTFSVLNDNGSAYSGTAGFSGINNNSATAALSGISTIAIDSAGNVWAAAESTSTIYEMIGAATPVVTPIVAGLISPYTPASKP